MKNRRNDVHCTMMMLMMTQKIHKVELLACQNIAGDRQQNIVNIVICMYYKTNWKDPIRIYSDDVNTPKSSITRRQIIRISYRTWDVAHEHI